MNKKEIDRITELISVILKRTMEDSKFIHTLELFLMDAKVSKEEHESKKVKALANIMDIYNESKDNLENRLEDLDVPSLVETIKHYNLDTSPNKKSYRWKTKSRLIDLILNQVSARANKGSEFINY